MAHESNAPHPTPALLAAVDAAYRVFAPYAQDFQAVVCQCRSCVSQEDRVRLLKLPLREIDGALLMQYQWSAHDTADPATADDLRYLLPRAFDLLAVGDPALLSEQEMIFAKLGAYPWSTQWPVAEREVITAFFEAVFNAALDQDLLEIQRYYGARLMRCQLSIDVYLAMLIKAGWDAGTILAIWMRRSDRAATLHRASLRFEIRSDADRPLDLALTNEEHYIAERPLADFLTGAKTEALMLAIAGIEQDPQARQLFDASFDLRFLQPSAEHSAATT